MNERCEFCQFWHPSQHFPKTDGICRRYPPSHARQGDCNNFPQVKHYAWCGEFVPAYTQAEPLT